MKLNIKLILLGGLVYYIAQWIVAMATGFFIHEGILDAAYRSAPEFWRPELNQDPPDMAALMPYWITTGLIGAFVGTFIYDNVRAALAGSPVIKGLKFGFLMALFYASFNAGWSGIFNLPSTIWVWWAVDGFIIFMLSGMALGWIAQRLAAE
ncbi:MAG: hypothetical protein HKN58_00105 [Xanthomonadales bacterium]|nr:hypothetical protein [Xanthomonadales bacterium]